MGSEGSDIGGGSDLADDDGDGGGALLPYKGSCSRK